MDLARLGVSIDPTDAKKGAREIDRALDDVGRSAEKNLGKLDRENQKVGNSATVAGTRTKGAFDRIRSSIASIIAGTQRLGGSFSALTQKMLGTGRAATATKGKLEGMTGGSASLHAQSILAGAGLGRMAGAMGLVAGAAGAALPVIAALLAALLPLIVAVKTITTIFGLMKRGVNIAGEFQRLEISFTALTGSATEANRILIELRKNAMKTGIAVADQARTVQKFLALGFKTDDALQLQRSILDVAGAVGMSTTEANLLGTALAQVQAKGVASMEELRQQIAEKGVPIFDELARKTGLFGAALFDAIAKGEIPASKVIEIFQNLEGSFAKFRGGAERLAQTIPGQIAVVGTSFENLLEKLGAPIADAIGPIFTDLINILQSGGNFAEKIGEAIGNAIRLLYQAISDGELESLIGNTFMAGVEIGLNFLANGFIESVLDFGSLLVSTVEFAGKSVGNSFKTAFADAVNFFAERIEKIIQAIMNTLAEISQVSNSVLKTDFSVKPFALGSLGRAKPDLDNRSFADINSGNDQFAAFGADQIKNPFGTDFQDAAAKAAEDLMTRSLERTPKGSFSFDDPSQNPSANPALDPTGDPSGGGKGKALKEENKEIEVQLSLLGELQQRLGNLATEWLNVGRIVTDIAEGSIKSFTENLASALTNVATGAQSAGDAFRDMANSIINSIIQMIIQMTIQLAVAQALAALGVPVAAVGTFQTAATASTGGGTSVNHAGSGNGGGVTTNRGFAKFHNGGVLSSENLSLTDKNETVLTRRTSDDLKKELAQAREASSGDEKGERALQIVNVLDQNEVLEMVAANPDVTVNAISRRRRQVDGLLKQK